MAYTTDWPIRLRDVDSHENIFYPAVFRKMQHLVETIFDEAGYSWPGFILSVLVRPRQPITITHSTHSSMLGRGYPLDLQVALADHYPEEDARTIADSLVDKETPTTRFIGLTGACETALYWDAGVHDILQCDITREGVDGLIRRNIARISSVAELDAWIHHASESYFAWIAPAYR